MKLANKEIEQGQEAWAKWAHFNSRKAGRFQLYQGLKRRKYHWRYPLKYDTYNDAADNQLGPVLTQQAKRLVS